MEFIHTAAIVPIVALVNARVAIFRSILCLALRLFTHVLNLPAYWSQNPNTLFLFLLTLRYYRLAGHILGNYVFYRPDEPPENPIVTGEQAHVIIPTIDPGNIAFERCIRSILAHSPRSLTIVCGGPEHVSQTTRVIQSLDSQSFTNIQVTHTRRPDKRRQLRHGMIRVAQHVKADDDTILVFVDDHAWWEGQNFLAFLLAPFEKREVGLVGTRKRVHRDGGSTFTDNMINMLACYYLERHNFEIAGQNAVDGGAFVISARTCAIRAKIVLQERFLHDFIHESCTLPVFGTFGPLISDDDNFITRFVMREGWQVKFQSDDNDENIMYTTLGIDGWSKIHDQLLRWARSQWRSNYTSLSNDLWHLTRYWGWTLHVGYLWSFFNIAIVWDALIIYMWFRSSMPISWCQLAILILGSKCIKISNHLWRNPKDMFFLPLQILFSYAHAYFKIRALLSANDISWGGRHINIDNEPGEDGDLEGESVLDGTESNSGSQMHYSTSTGSNSTENAPRTQSPSISSSLRTERISPIPILRNVHNSSTASAGRKLQECSADMKPAALSTASALATSINEAPFMSEASTTPSCIISDSTVRAKSVEPTRNPSNANLNSFIEEYGIHPPVSGTANPFTPDGCVNTAFSHLWSAKAQENRHNDEGRPEDRSRSQSTTAKPAPSSAETSKSSSSLPEASARSSVKVEPALVDVPPCYKPVDPRTPLSGTSPMDIFCDSTPVSFDPDVLPVSSKPAVTKQGNVTQSTPPVSDLKTVSIVYKKENASCRATSPMANKVGYQRDFVRGGDCNRVHGEGRFLTQPRQSLDWRPRCRSPQTFDRYGQNIVPGKPRC